MAWTRDTTSGVYTHTGTTTEAVVATDKHAANAEFSISLENVASKVRAYICGHTDGNTGWELGIDPADSTKILIRPVEYGTPGAAVAGSTAHAVTAGLPCVLKARIEGQSLSVSISSSGVAETSLTYTVTDGKFLNFRRYGFVSNVNNARVLSMSVSELTAVEGERTNVLAMVAGGLLYESENPDAGFTQIAGRVGPDNGPVSMAEFNGNLYIVGGGLATIYDPLTKTITAWSDTDHPTSKLPGATDKGTTTATLVEAHRSRIFLAVGDRLYASSINDPNDFDSTDYTLGNTRAIQAERIGDVIRCLHSLPNNSLLVGCDRSISLWQGDPILGAVERVTISRVMGISSANAVADVSQVLTMIHTPEGLYMLPANGLPLPLHREVLTDSIAIPAASITDYYVHLARDPARYGLHVFLNPKTTSTNGTHFFYDERVGQYAINEGGLFPDVYPSDVRPTASVQWNGLLVVGTSDGRVLTPSDTTYTDGGSAFTPTVSMNLLADAAPVADTKLTSLQPLIDQTGSSIKLNVYGGLTPQQVYTSTTRRRLAGGTFAWTTPASSFIVAAPALVVEVTSATAGTTWAVETIVANTEPGGQVSPRAWVIPSAPSAPCQPFTGTGTGTGTGTLGTGPGVGSGTLPTGTGTSTITGTGTLTGTGNGGWSGVDDIDYL